MQNLFWKWSAVTLAAVFGLILFGASVRASGAGMGCPDWPLCFGQWIPPTHVDQLPENYQEIYADRGYDEMEFNAVKTWTEYVNRLFGALVGMLVFGSFLLSTAFWRSDWLIPTLTFSALIFTGTAAWLGMKVVMENLNPATITAHMALALLIVTALIWALARSRRERYGPINAEGRLYIQGLVAACIILSLAQIFMGTQVRQNIDVIAGQLGQDQRASWVTELGILFYVHRSFSILVLAANAALAYTVHRYAPQALAAVRMARVLIAVLIAEIAAGTGLYYLGFPAVLQPLHLLFAALMFGAQLYIALVCRYGRAPASSHPASA